ncbi:MAG: hypothetical protein IKC73_07940 [Clostridia bacterium]|nr:hypothetical protein [Clostridia bacterium]
MEYRTEHDSMGEVRVPCDRYYGAQTARSLENFKIGEHRMPEAVIRALGALKLAAARANARLVPDRMTAEKCAAIEAAAREVMDGTLLDHFPLVSIYFKNRYTVHDCNYRWFDLIMKT